MWIFFKNECHLYCLTHAMHKTQIQKSGLKLQKVHKMWMDNFLALKLVRKDLKVDTA